MPVPEYLSDANLDDPREALAWVFAQWPKVGESQPYPAAPRPLLGPHSEFAYALGVRVHPELATLKKVPGENGSPVFIPVDEPDPVPAAGSAGDVSVEVLGLLAQVSPEMAARVAAMTPDEREKAVEDNRAAFEQAVSALAELQDKFGGE